MTSGWSLHSTGDGWEKYTPVNMEGLELELIVHQFSKGSWWISAQAGSPYLCGANLQWYSANFGYWDSFESAERAVDTYLSIHGMSDFIV